MPKIKPEYSLLPPEEAKKEDQKQQYPVDQKSKDNLTFENNENRDKNAATTNKTDAKIGKSDAKPGQIKEKEIKEKKIKTKEKKTLYKYKEKAALKILKIWNLRNGKRNC